MRAVRRIIPVLLAVLMALGGCEQDPVERMRSKIAGGHDPETRNTQTEARELFDALCDRRGFSNNDCDCMRRRMLRAGSRALAYIGANYSGDLESAAEIAAEMDEEGRAAALNAYIGAETACLAPGAGRDLLNARPRIVVPEPDIEPGGDGAPAPPPDFPRMTLADVRASCRPAMADVCACRAELLQTQIGDGAFAVAVAINSGDRAGMDRLARGREDNWAQRAADAYARTGAPCIVQVSNQRRR